ncbi:MAG: amino acid transporter, partial [Flammeovirgaceae bacterium]|nr:amino acid transporter [Flammeovirgaceae bacterium]
HTPYKSNAILFIFVGLFAGLVPGDVTGDLTSFGTLFAFVLVCAGVWVMRVKNPDLKRPFVTPLVPLVPILGMLVCGALIASLDTNTLTIAFAWMAFGLVVYFGYGKAHSYLRNGKK